MKCYRCGVENCKFTLVLKLDFISNKFITCKNCNTELIYTDQIGKLVLIYLVIPILTREIVLKSNIVFLYQFLMILFICWILIVIIMPWKYTE